MEHPVYDLAIAPMLSMLKNLDAIVSKAEAHLDAHPDIEPATLVQARLYPNMRSFVFQVQVATDVAKGAAARLSGNTPPSWPDDEESFDDIHQRIRKAIDFISGFSPEDFDGAEQRDIELKLREETVRFSGSEYISSFALPNVFFHVTTAYNILRHNGVPLGKRDFLGWK
jgi:hypothetical protein